MLTRAEIAAKLADIDLILPKTDGGNVHLEEYREALETARQLGEWLEKATSVCADCQHQFPECVDDWEPCMVAHVAARAWLRRGEGQ